MTSHVVKRQMLNIEPYQREKLQASIHAACLSVRTLEGEAQTTALEVCKKVENWLESKIEVTSNDIRRKAGEALQIYNPDAAYVYKVAKGIE